MICNKMPKMKALKKYGKVIELHDSDFFMYCSNLTDMPWCVILCNMSFGVYPCQMTSDL